MLAEFCHQLRNSLYTADENVFVFAISRNSLSHIQSE